MLWLLIQQMLLLTGFQSDRETPAHITSVNTQHSTDRRSLTSYFSSVQFIFVWNTRILRSKYAVLVNVVYSVYTYNMACWPLVKVNVLVGKQAMKQISESGGACPFWPVSVFLVEGSNRSMQSVGLLIDCAHFADIPSWWRRTQRVRRWLKRRPRGIDQILMMTQ